MQCKLFWDKNLFEIVNVLQKQIAMTKFISTCKSERDHAEFECGDNEKNFLLEGAIFCSYNYWSRGHNIF